MDRRAHAGPACAQVRGACRIERGDEPDTDDRANFFGGSQSRRNVHAPQTHISSFLVCRVSRLEPTLVVKISDTYQHSVGHQAWTRVDGFSEAVIARIAASEEAMH